MIDVEHLSVDLGGRAILHDVSLAVRRGSFSALMGPNGSGKTTLIRALYRAVARRGGVVRIDGHDIETYDRRTLGRLVAVLRQEPRLEFDFTVEEVVLMGRSPYKRLLEADTLDDAEIVASALHMTDTSHVRRRVFTTLSGGEKQRVLLARAIAQRPSVLLLDEPTNHLDIRHQLAILECIKKLNVTVLAALHDINLALRYADDVILMREGRVHAAGPIGTLSEARVQEVFEVQATRIGPVLDFEPLRP